MDPSRWQRVQELFHAALGERTGAREEYVRRHAAGDDELVEAVLRLLEADATSDDDELLLSGESVDAIAAKILAADEPRIESIGPYRIVAEIGRGGMGVVYLAARDDLDARCAIKVLTDAGLSPERYRRFLSEQRILARLQHPSIARLLDAGAREDGTPFIVMEHVDGRPITEHCESEELGLRERLELFREVAEAVLAAHRQAIVHRDIKPSNVLVRRTFEDGNGRVKLLDFGIAKVLDEDGPNDATETRLRMMTPAYAAPEQVRGEPVGTYTDVYALGVLLYELLAGDKPHDLATLTPGRAEEIITQQDPERPSLRAARRGGGGIRARRSEWADLDVLCLKALHKSPERRYATVEALLRDLDRFVNGEPLEARPEGFTYRLGKFARRHRRELSIASVAATIVIGITIVYGVHLARARDSAVAEAARTERVQEFMLSLFGDPYDAPAADVDVTTLLARGVREADILDEDPAIQAELLATLGQIYRQLGLFADSERLVDRAWWLRRESFGERAPETAASLMDRALLSLDRGGGLDAAEQDARRALEIVEAALPRGARQVAHAHDTLGRVLTELGRYDEAIEELELAVEIESQRGETKTLAEMLGNLASAHAYAQSYERADALHERLLEMHARLFGRDHPRYASTLLNLASTYTRRGFHEEAEARAREALAIHREVYGGDHLATASNLSILGQVLFNLGKFDEAEAALSEALSIKEARLGERHRLVAVSLSHLSNVATRRGDLERAQGLLERQISIYRETFDGPHPWIATASSNLATIAYKRGRLEEAVRHLRNAVETYEATMSASSLEVAIARIKLGQALTDAGRLDEAERALRAGRAALEGQVNPSSMWIEQANEALEQLDAARASRDATS